MRVIQAGYFHSLFYGAATSFVGFLFCVVFFVFSWNFQRINIQNENQFNWLSNVSLRFEQEPDIRLSPITLQAPKILTKKTQTVKVIRAKVRQVAKLQPARAKPIAKRIPVSNDAAMRNVFFAIQTQFRMGLWANNRSSDTIVNTQAAIQVPKVSAASPKFESIPIEDFENIRGAIKETSSAKKTLSTQPVFKQEIDNARESDAVHKDSTQFAAPPVAKLAMVSPLDNPEFLKSLLDLSQASVLPKPKNVIVSKMIPKKEIAPEPMPVHKTADVSASKQAQAQSLHSVELTAQFVRAFLWDEPVSNVTKIQRTAHIGRGSWVEYQASGFKPTRVWATQSNVSFPVPLINDVEATWISKPGTGVVFGKMDIHTEVDLVGAGDDAGYEKVEYFPAQSPEYKYFLFHSVRPGAYLFYVTDGSEPRKTAAISVPVSSGVSTYLEMTGLSPSLRTMTGRVVASEEDLIENAFVRVLGQPDAFAETSEDGSFVIKNLWKIKNYPIPVEVGGPVYQHRYEVSSSFLNDLVLSVFTDEQINNWASQLNLDSKNLSLAIAKPVLATQPKGKDIVGQVRALTDLGTATIFTWSSNRVLEKSAEVRANEPEFLATNLTTGGMFGELVDVETQEVLWSEFFVAQPNIINVLIPN